VPKVNPLRAALVAAAVLLVLLPAARADDPETLKARGTELAAAEQEARLELFALESRLATARTAVARVESRLAAVQRERVASRRQLRAAKRTLAAAEQGLAEQVRALYVQEEPDLVSIFLGASSIEEAIDSIDTIERAAAATTGVLGEAKAARKRVVRLLESLTTRRNELRTLRASAIVRARDLESAQSSRLSYIAQLQAEQVLNEQQIAQAITEAQAAQSTASLETVKAEAVPSISSIGTETTVEPVLQPQPSPEPQAPVPASGRQLTVITTAYMLRGTTATGIPAGPGVVAVDPSVIPLGTRMTIPGYGEGVAADTGGAITGNRIDVWVATAAEAAQWQWKTVTITLH
jgi:3D (Asp-Asp-Asp) domain-containing protein/peptidoglycan hydrolase CwlO-like protein